MRIGGEPVGVGGQSGAGNVIGGVGAIIRYGRIPPELTAYAQWALATREDKRPFIINATGHRVPVSPTTPPWMTFEAASTYAVAHDGCHIGYVLTRGDPYTCIDIDIRATSEPSLLREYERLVSDCPSYAEISASGVGLHIWLCGDIGAGRRDGGVEIYSRERFIICTGDAISKIKYDVINNFIIPIRIEQKINRIVKDDELLIKLLKEMPDAVIKAPLDASESADVSTDDEIWKRARGAENNYKFSQLCAGNWDQFGFPSQSEADLALLSIFAFYSKCNEQCRRMFRSTNLGAREKSQKNNRYLDATLQIIRSRQKTESENLAVTDEVVKTLLGNIRSDSKSLVSPEIKSYVETLNNFEHAIPEPEYALPDGSNEIEWPPGLVGAIAAFIFGSAPRPVREVAIVAALGLMAGITGRAYNIGQTGINLYIILVARSGVGKEAMHSGIGHILQSGCGFQVSPYVSFSDYVSGPALVKALDSCESFVNVSGEWGQKLKRMAENAKDPAMQQLRAVMTNLYQKSSAGSVVGGLAYSNRDQNVDTIASVAYSMIGETTPGTFYNALTPTMMEDGFLSRFNIFEYSGDRPKENQQQITVFPDDLSNKLGDIASHCANITGCQISISPEAKSKFDAFNLLCDTNINLAGADESIRQVWNRAHLKSLRISGVLAAADNFAAPVITGTHADWALSMLQRDTQSMLQKINDGDIGTDDGTRFKKVMRIIVEFLRGIVAKSYGIHPRMISDGVVPRSYLQVRTNRLQCFQNHRLGSSLALDHTLKTAIDSGYILEMAKSDAVLQYRYHGRCFKVINVIT